MRNIYNGGNLETFFIYCNSFFSWSIEQNMGTFMHADMQKKKKIGDDENSD